MQDLHDIDNHGKASILAQQATTISTPNDRGTYSPSMVDTECGNYGGPANNSQPLRDIFPGYAVFDTSDFFVQSDLILSTRDSYDESRESCTQYDMSQRLLPGSDSSLHSILQSELKKELVYSTDDPSHLSHSTLYNLSGQSTLEDASSQRGESDPTWMQENSGHRILPSFEHTDKQFPQTAYDLNVNDSILAMTQGNDSNDAGTLGCESQSNNADISEWRLDGKALTVHSQSREDQRQSQHNEKGRRALDDFLIRSKLSGMSYKEIKLKGNFREAESTLRGRFRNLTKPRENRVRKPRWNERDVTARSALMISRQIINSFDR